MAFIMFFAGTPPSLRRAYEAEERERQATERVKAEQLRKELEKNPALRHRMELEAWRKLDEQRESAFEGLQDMELHSTFRYTSIPQAMAAQKRFWAWRKQALSELQQLRETEEMSRGHLAHEINDSPAWGNIDKNLSILDWSSSAESPVYSAQLKRILPITTPDAFALKYRPTTDSSVEEQASSFNWRPGKRFSLCEMPQIQCKPHYCRWLKESVGLGLVKDFSCGDQVCVGF